MIQKTKKYCLNCGRENSGVPLSTITERGYEITAPWCPGTSFKNLTCEPLTEEEKRSPRMRSQWVDSPYEYAKKMGWIDRGIQPYLDEFRQKGLTTIFSCDGHGHHGYVTFILREDFETARTMLEARGVTCYSESRPHRLFGETHKLTIHRDFIKDAVTRSERLERSKDLTASLLSPQEKDKNSHANPQGR